MADNVSPTGSDSQNVTTTATTESQDAAITADKVARAEFAFKKRYAEQKAKHAAEIEKLKEELSAKKEPDPNLVNDYKTKYDQMQNELTKVRKQMSETRNSELKAVMTEKLTSLGCVESELLVESLMNKGVVKFDDDGNRIVESVTGDLDELLTDELAKRPHLQRPTNRNGLGTTGPKNIGTATQPGQVNFSDRESAKAAFKNMTRDQILENAQANLGGNLSNDGWMSNRKKK